MDRIDGENWIDIGGGRRGFRDRNALGGLAGTEVTAKYLNGVQEELIALIGAGGQSPDHDDTEQVLKSLAVFAQTGMFVYAEAGGTANAIVADLVAGATSLVAGMGVRLKLSTTNTSGNVTLDINGLGAKAIQRPDSSDPLVGELSAGKVCAFVYDGSDWILQTPAVNTVSLGANGFIRFPSGLTLQWGTSTLVSGTRNITFPIAFTTLYALLATANAGSNIGSGIITSTGPSTASNSGFTMVGAQFVPTTAAVNASFYWLAIGVS